MSTVHINASINKITTLTIYELHCSVTIKKTPLIFCKYSHVNVQTCNIKQSYTILHTFFLWNKVLPSPPEKNNTGVSMGIYCEVNKRNNGSSFLIKFVLNLKYIIKSWLAREECALENDNTFPRFQFENVTTIYFNFIGHCYANFSK